MQVKRCFLIGVLSIIVSSLMISGCAVNFYKQSPRSKTKIKNLEEKIVDLKQEQKEEREHFEEVKRILEKKLGGPISEENVSLEMIDHGLVIILSDDILFDSGKAKIKNKAYPVLDKVAGIIKKEVSDKNIGISGHTDNIPIKHSKWESNWELSSARATNVLHYLEKKGVSPAKLSATGYGEHKPIASNATDEGRAKNRRVEIVILPAFEEERKENTGGYIK